MLTALDCRLLFLLSALAVLKLSAFTLIKQRIVGIMLQVFIDTRANNRVNSNDKRRGSTKQSTAHNHVLKNSKH